MLSPSSVRCNLWRLMATAGALAGAAAAAAGTLHLVRAWAGYGRPKLRPNPLLDPFMPNPEVAERHEVGVRAPADVTLAAVRAVDLWDSPVAQAIFRGRRVLMGVHSSTARTPTPFLAEVEALGWGLLAQVPGRGVAYGSVTKPWEPEPRFRGVAPADFAAFDEPGYAKIVWSLQVDPVNGQACRLSTETRVATTDAGSRARFRRYWTVLSVGILLLRVIMLRQVQQAAERRAPVRHRS